MTVELIGWISPRVSSEIIRPQGPVFSKDVIAHTARIHEDGGFDKVLVGYFSSAPDGFMVAAHAGAKTERLGFLLAHRPGFVAPTLAARKLATLDQLTDGRLSVHIISGGSEADQAKDGDHTDHSSRYQRSAEYVRVLRQTWSSPRPFDHKGDFYQVEGAYSEIRCVAGDAGIPVYGGGGSDAAVELLSPGLDTFMLWGEPLADTAAFMARVRAAAAPSGRAPTFSVSTRPILGRTDAEAWDRARAILAQIESTRKGPPPTPRNAGSQRLLAAAAAGEVWDSCLWTPLAAATGAQGNSTALVGSPETVARAMAAYTEIGVDKLLIRGYDPLPDAEEYGRELVPRVRELVAERERGLALSTR